MQATLIFRNGFVLLSLAAVLATTGCSTRRPATQSSCPKISLKDCGVIGIISTSSIPNIRIQKPLEKTEAARNCARSRVLVEVIPHLGPDMVSGLIGGTAALCDVPMVLAGPVVGKVRGLPSETLNKADRAIFACANRQQLHDGLRVRTCDILRERNGAAKLVEKPFPKNNRAEFEKLSAVMCGTLAWVPNRQKPMDYLATQQLDTVLEIELRDPALQGNEGINPWMGLQIEGIARVIDMRTRQEMARCSFSYRGEKLKFVEWARDDAAKLQKEFDRAYDSMGRQIVMQLFQNDTAPATGLLTSAN